MPGRPAPRPLPRYSLRPAFALASIVLLAATGVISGILVGPSPSTMVHVPTPAGPNVTVTRDEAPSPSQAAVIPAVAGLVDEPPVGTVATPRASARAADTHGGFGGLVLEPTATPVRVKRAAAKRPRIVTPRPSFVIPVSTDDRPETLTDVAAPTAPKADEPWASALFRVAPQAP